jgi:hypothetical protein
MRRTLRNLSVIASAAVWAVAHAATADKAAEYQPGMLIKGDQEAPLVLYVVPWQEPRVPEVPEADLQPVLPKVLDDDYGILRRSRAAGGGDVNGAAGRTR